MTTRRFDAVFSDWQDWVRRELDRRAASPACLPFSRLATLAELPASSQNETERMHLESCRRCRTLYQRLQRPAHRESQASEFPVPGDGDSLTPARSTSTVQAPQ
ncbi:MAG: hypothetical protein P9F19_05365 [Candidatus Contendobacter sp.]|nr:hypothetical protein [Candidatus Contendobacter sp.]